VDVAIEARQLEAGERLGARVGTEGLYDVVVEGAGTAESLARSIESSHRVEPWSCSACISGRSRSTGCRCSTARHVIPSLEYCAADDKREMDDAAAMLARDPEIARSLITHRYPIEDAAEAFRVAGDKASNAIRVVIKPT
jgi:hypothetical protein